MDLLVKLDAWNVPTDICENDELLLNLLQEAARKMGAKILATNRYRAGHSSPPGAICSVLIDMSVLYCHTFSKEKCLTALVFSCGRLDSTAGMKHIIRRLELSQDQYRWQTLT